MNNDDPNEYVVGADLAARYSRLRFTDWREVATVENIYPCGSVSFFLNRPLPEGQHLIFGKRAKVQDIVADIKRTLDLCR